MQAKWIKLDLGRLLLIKQESRGADLGCACTTTYRSPLFYHFLTITKIQNISYESGHAWLDGPQDIQRVNTESCFDAPKGYIAAVTSNADKIS